MAEIQHVDNLSKDFGDLFLKKEFSDVTLIVESKSFSCHKLILASRSEYFKALLFGSYHEAEESTIELKDISSKAFQLILTELVFDVFHIAHQFTFESLVKSLSSYLMTIINILNVCVIFEKALFYEQVSLVEVCNKYIDDHANEIIVGEEIIHLSMSTLETILRRNSFVVEEIKIFHAVHKWIQYQEEPGEQSQKMLEVVRLPLITAKDLLKVVRPTNLFPNEAILDAMDTQITPNSGEIIYRKRC